LSGLSSIALKANIGLTIRAFRHRALLPRRGNLRPAHAARLTSFHCRLRCSAFLQVTLVAQILLPFRFVFTRSPLRARRHGAATPTFQITIRLQTVSSLLFVTSSAQILVFVQFTLVPASSGVRFIADETLPVRILHVFFRPTREAQILFVVVQTARFAKVSPALLALLAVFSHASFLWSALLLFRVVSLAVFSLEREHGNDWDDFPRGGGGPPTRLGPHGLRVFVVLSQRSDRGPSFRALRPDHFHGLRLNRPHGARHHAPAAALRRFLARHDIRLLLDDDR